MKREVFVLSSVMAILSLNGLFICAVIKIVLPFLGRIAYQAVAKGSYSALEYQADFRVLFLVCSLIFLGSMIVSVKTYLKFEKSGGEK